MINKENLTKAIGMLFDTEMVKAILSGRKTQTMRRMRSPMSGYNPTMREDGLFECCENFDVNEASRKKYYIRKPKYKKGDLIYVRETFAFANTSRLLTPSAVSEESIKCWKEKGLIWYKADKNKPLRKNPTAGEWLFERGVWRPSIHMPKWAARIFLEVTDVKIYRPIDIFEDQAKAEGVDKGRFFGYGCLGEKTYKEGFLKKLFDIYDEDVLEELMWVYKFKLLEVSS